MEPSFEYQGDPDFFNPCQDEREMEMEWEREQDQLLEQQELEDFEQADEYFDHWGSYYEE